ncbi:Uncharacterised protein [Vibrio cholerae]|nr:Uncharacterised protein [Vibrio cholerae]
MGRLFPTEVLLHGTLLHFQHRIVINRASGVGSW